MKRNTNTKIRCKVSQQGIHSFYLITGKESFFLFNQKYTVSVQNYYKREMSLNEAIDYSRSNKNSAITRTMTKLPMYIKYIEKEYGIQVLDQTIRKTNRAKIRNNRQERQIA